MDAGTDAIICFGKIPTHGDFLRFRSDGDLARRLDEWIQQSLYFLKNRSVSLLEGAPAYRFFMQQPDGAALIGVMQPSRDRVGRRYPVVVAREVEAPVPGSSHLMPLACADFLTAAARLAAAAAEGNIAHHDIEAQVATLPDAKSAIVASGMLSEYLRGTTFRDVATSAWEYFEDTRKYLVFKNLVDAGATMQEHGAGGLGRGLHLPLSGDDDAAAVAFWLLACSSIVGMDLSTASFFWSDCTGGAGSSLFLFPDKLTVPGFAAMFAAVDGISDAPLDLQSIGRDRGVEAVLSLPARYGDLLEDDSLTLEQMLERL